MTPAMIEASQAVIRRTASMKSRAISGTEESNTVTHRLATGLRLVGTFLIPELET